MASLFESLAGQLGGTNLSQLSKVIGADEKTTGTAATAAMSTLLGALSRNASREEGARSLHAALDKDHDGSLLDNVGGFLGRGDTTPGDGILKHVLGSRRPRVESQLGKATGLEAGAAGKLLSLLAPMVMGALGRAQRGAGVDAGGLASMLGRERDEVARNVPQASGFMALLDADGDGDVDLGDLAKKGSGLLGKLFR